MLISFILAFLHRETLSLRKEFYKSASTQLALLRSIGVSEMEREYESRIKFVKERLEPLKETYGPQFKTELDETDVKETLHVVLNESLLL